jgi:site-specific DNA recombinase
MQVSTQVGIYARVSTDEQAREGYSIGAQRDRLLAFCRAQGWDVTGIYIDDGHSGAKLDRPALNRLRDDARARIFDLVLVWKVHRMSRKVAHLATLVDEFDCVGVAFRSVTEPFDTSHAAGRAFMQMLGVFAELERENIRERSILGIRKRVEQGFVHGRPTMLGYRFVEKGKIEVDPASAAVVRWIFQQYLSGVGTLRIAQQLIGGVTDLQTDVLYREFKHVSPHSVRDRISWIIKNPIYAGYAAIGDDLYAGRHEAIIDPATWQRAQAQIQSRQSLPNRAHASRYLLTGRIVCGQCGAPMFGYRQPNRSPETRHIRPYYEYYCCRGNSCFQGRSKTCDNWGVKREQADEAALNALRGLALEGVDGRSTPSPPEDPVINDLSRRRQQIQASLGQAEKRQRNLFRAIEEAPDLDEAVLQRVRELAEEQKQLTLELAGVERALRNGGHVLSRAEVESLLRDVPRILDAAGHD